jgi:hypothetical protein
MASKKSGIGEEIRSLVFEKEDGCGDAITEG